MQTIFVLSFLFASCSVHSASLFASSPIKALDDVEQALKKVTALPHLSSSQQKSAKSVIQFVMHTVEDVESSKNMSKEVTAKKVKQAIGQLQALEKQWAVATKNMTVSERKIGELQAELAEKRQQLTKEEGMLKLAKLKKELLEKKLLLKKLVARQAESKEHSPQSDVPLTEAEVKQINATANKLTKGNSTKAAQIAAVLKMLHSRQHEVEASLKNLDDIEKKSDREIANFAGKSANAKEDGGIKKAARMLKNIKKQSHRKIEKAKAAQKVELANVNSAVESIENGDVKGISKVLIKMKESMQPISSRPDFIY